MLNYKINFNQIEWESPIEGVKCKAYTYDNKRIRLIEYTKEMPPHWCEKGHYGLILEGEIDDFIEQLDMADKNQKLEQESMTV